MAFVALHCSTQIFSNRTPRIYREIAHDWVPIDAPGEGGASGPVQTTCPSQSGVAEQRDRERHFGDDEYRADPAPLSTAAPAVFALERKLRLCVARLHCGDDTENDRDHSRNAEGQREHAPIYRDGAQSRHLRRRHDDKRSQHQECEPHTQN